MTIQLRKGQNQKQINMPQQMRIRVITSRAYHALFMHNMLIRPTAEELANFGEPDYTIYNAGGLMRAMGSQTQCEKKHRQESGIEVICTILLLDVS